MNELQSMRDEFIKIAKDDDGRKAMLAGAAGAGAGMVGSGLSAQAAGLAGEREAAMEGSDALRQTVAKGSPVPIKSNPMAAQAGGGAYANTRAAKMMGLGDEAQILVDSTGKGPSSVLAHEIGHAKFDKSGLGKMTQNIPARLAFNMSSLASPLAGVGAGYGIDDDRKALAVSAGVPLAIAAPTLLSEGAATMKGLSHLRRAGATPAQMAAARKTLLRAFGSYAGKAGMDTGLGVGGYGVGRHLRGALEEEE